MNNSYIFKGRANVFIPNNILNEQDNIKLENATLNLSNNNDNVIPLVTSDDQSKIVCSASNISITNDLSNFNGTLHIKDHAKVKMQNNGLLPKKININNPQTNNIIYIESNNINVIPTANINYTCNIAAANNNEDITINNCTIHNKDELEITNKTNKVTFNSDVFMHGKMTIDCNSIKSKKLDFSNGIIEIKGDCQAIEATSMVLGKSLTTINSANIININVAGELTSLDNSPMEFSFKIDPSNRKNDTITAITIKNQKNKTISLKEYKLISQIINDNCEYKIINSNNNSAINLNMEEKIYLDPNTQQKYKFSVIDNKLIISKNSDSNNENTVEKEVESIITHSVAKSAMSSATRASSMAKSFDTSEFAESGNINFKDSKILKRSASDHSKEKYISYGKYRVWNKCEVGDETIFATSTAPNQNISYANSDYRVVCGIDASPHLIDNGVFCMNSLFAQYMKTRTLENAVGARAQSQYNYMLGGKTTWFTKKWALNLLGSAEIMDSAIDGAKCTGYVLNCSCILHSNLKINKIVTISPNVSLGATKVIVNPIKIGNDLLRCYTPVNFSYSVGVDCAYKATNFDVKTIIKSHFSDNNTTKIYRNLDNVNNNIEMKNRFMEYGLHFTKKSKEKTSFEFSFSKFAGGKNGTSIESVVKTLI